ncbi:E2/UBC family protein [Phormidium nigroviride]
MRRQFRLPFDDEEYLNARGLPWEAVTENCVQRVVVFGFPVPPGYNCAAIELNLRIPSGYPDAQIDMAYFHPPLARTDGRPIKAIANDSFDGKQWQRWSRHRTPANPWCPGLDCIATHLALVEEWLKKELTKG